MPTPSDILKELTEAIAHVYARPGMYGSGDMVDATLHTLHWCWAMTQRREQEFRDALERRRKEVRADCLLLSDAYRKRHPNAKSATVVRHIIGVWRVISGRLGITPSLDAGEVQDSAVPGVR